MSINTKFIVYANLSFVFLTRKGHRYLVLIFIVQRTINLICFSNIPLTMHESDFSYMIFDSFHDYNYLSLSLSQVYTGGKKKKDEISVESLDYTRKILHTAWHPNENIIAVAATNNLFIFKDRG